MLDDKKIKELKHRIKVLLDEGIIVKGSKGEHVDFFVENANHSLDSARLLFKTSTDKELQDFADFHDFNGFLWVINASYLLNVLHGKSLIR